MASNAAVSVEIETVAEELKKKVAPSAKAVAIEGSSAFANSIPADAELRRYFSARGVTGAQLQDSISQFASRALNRSLKIMQHAWALKRLAARFSADDLRSLDADARAKCLALIQQHAQALAQQNQSLRQELLPVFAASSGVDEGREAVAIKSDDDLIRAIERLFEVCSANDRVMLQAFAITPDGSKDSTIRTPQIWRALNNAETIADAIARSQ